MTLTTMTDIIRFSRFPPERRRMGAHDLIIHPKVASTSLRTLGDHVKQHAPWDRPTVAFIRDPLDRWTSGYVMYLNYLARHQTGFMQWQPPHHYFYDLHTTPQAYKVKRDTYLIRFEHLNQYADRMNITIPHLHETPRTYLEYKTQLIRWLKVNPTFLQQLKHELQIDYQLREKCQSVQSLPENLFTK